MLKAVLRSLMLPPAGPLLLAALGALLIGRRRRFGWSLLWVGLGSLWLLSTASGGRCAVPRRRALPGVGPDAADPTRRPSSSWAEATSGIGRPNIADLRPMVSLLERLAYGAFLAKRLSLPVLVTGTSDRSGCDAHHAGSQLRRRDRAGPTASPTIRTRMRTSPQHCCGRAASSASCW